MIDTKSHKNSDVFFDSTDESGNISLLSPSMGSDKKIPKNKIIAHVKQYPQQFKNCYFLIEPKWRADLVDIALQNPDRYRDGLIEVLLSENHNPAERAENTAKFIVKEAAAKKPRVFFGTDNRVATRKYTTALEIMETLKQTQPNQNKENKENNSTTQQITESLRKNAVTNDSQQASPVLKTTQAKTTYTNYQTQEKKLARQIKIPAQKKQTASTLEPAQTSASATYFVSKK